MTRQHKSSRISFIVLKFLIAASVLALSFWYLATQFDWGGIGALLTNFRYGYFLFWCGLIYLIYICLRTVRWVVLIRQHDNSVRFKTLYLPSAVFIGLSMLTPGQLGEALKIKALVRNGNFELSVLVGSFVLERLLDLLCIGLLSVISLTVIAMAGPVVYGVWLVLGALFFLFIAVVCLVVYMPGSHVTESILRTFKKINATGAIFQATLLTFSSWFLIALAWQISLSAIGVTVGYLQIVAVTALATISNIASFIPGGAGVSEMVISELLISIGIESTHAQAGSLLIRLLGLWWIGISLFHLFYWWLVPISPKRVS